MCVCVCVCACSQASISQATLSCDSSFFSFMDSFVFKQQVLFRVDFLSVTLDHRVQCPRGGARGQNLGHLKNLLFFFFAFIFLLCNQSFLKNRYYSRLTFCL